MRRGKERGREKEEDSETEHDEAAEPCSLRDGKASHLRVPLENTSMFSWWQQWRVHVSKDFN